MAVVAEKFLPRVNEILAEVERKMLRISSGLHDDDTKEEDMD